MLRILKRSLLATVLFTSNAMAQTATETEEPPSQQGFYLGAAAGLAIFWDIDDVEFDPGGLMVSASGGYRLNSSLRLESELLYEEAENEQGGFELKITRLLGTAYYDFPSTSILRLDSRVYGGIGGGVANLDNGNGGDEIEFTAHGEVGVSVPLTANFDVVPGVRVSYTTLAHLPGSGLKTTNDGTNQERLSEYRA